MSDLGQYDGWTIEEVVRRNTHELTAHHLLQAREYITEQRANVADDLAALRGTLDDAQRIGLAVLRARRAGRKTVRIDDVAGAS